MGEGLVLTPTSPNVLVHRHDIPMNGLQAPGDSDTLDKVDGAVQIISSSLAIGMVFTPPPINVACGLLAAVGSFISVGINAFGNPEDPVVKSFQELTKQLKKLEEKIIAKFDEMKVFISENKFSMEVIGEVAKLKKFMMEVFESSDQKLAIENFRRACDRTPPLAIAYTISSLLAQKTTNPLTMAIEKSHKDKEKAVAYWEDVFRTLIWDLVLIECIAAGLFKNKNLYYCERIIEESMEIDDILEEIEQNYNVGPWAEFKKNFPHFASRDLPYKGSDKKSRMEIVQNELKLKCPRDSFYICIFDSCEFEKDYYYHVGKPYNIVEVKDLPSYEHGNRKFNIFVYRSYKGTRIVQSEYDRLIEKMKKKYDNKKSLKELVELMKKDVRSDGLIAVMSRSSYIGFANCPEYSKGPGDFRMTWLGENKDKRAIDWIVGFP